MKISEKEIEKLHKIAFDYAFYKTGNIEASQDISSQAVSLFLLYDVQQSDYKRWIINTTKNYCLKYFDEVKKENKKTQKYGYTLLNDTSNNIEVEHDEDLSKAFKESFDALSDEELQTILYYFKCNKNIKEMHENLDISYVALRKRISRIKNKLKAETYKRLGFFGSSKIVTPQLNNLIVKFLQRLKKNIENNTVNRMYYYFSKIDITNYRHDIQIKKIIGYDIELKNGVYKAWIFYSDLNNIPEHFYIKFFIEQNHLKILTPPTKKNKMIVLDSHSEEGQHLLELMNKYPSDKTGRPQIPKEEMEKILSQHETNQNKTHSED